MHITIGDAASAQCCTIIVSPQRFSAQPQVDKAITRLVVGVLQYFAAGWTRRYHSQAQMHTAVCLHTSGKT